MAKKLTAPKLGKTPKGYAEGGVVESYADRYLRMHGVAADPAMIARHDKAGGQQQAAYAAQQRELAKPAPVVEQASTFVPSQSSETQLDSANPYSAQSDARYSQTGHYADGGVIKGPGTGTSDSIPAKLSDGEFVIPAHIVKKLGVDFFNDLIGSEKEAPSDNGMVHAAKGGEIDYQKLINNTTGVTPNAELGLGRPSVPNQSLPPGAGTDLAVTSFPRVSNINTNADVVSGNFVPKNTGTDIGSLRTQLQTIPGESATVTPGAKPQPTFGDTMSSGSAGSQPAFNVKNMGAGSTGTAARTFAEDAAGLTGKQFLGGVGKFAGKALGALSPVGDALMAASTIAEPSQADEIMKIKAANGDKDAERILAGGGFNPIANKLKQPINSGLAYLGDQFDKNIGYPVVNAIGNFARGDSSTPIQAAQPQGATAQAPNIDPNILAPNEMASDLGANLGATGVRKDSANIPKLGGYADRNQVVNVPAYSLARQQTGTITGQPALGASTQYRQDLGGGNYIQDRNTRDQASADRMRAIIAQDVAHRTDPEYQAKQAAIVQSNKDFSANMRAEEEQAQEQNQINQLTAIANSPAPPGLGGQHAHARRVESALTQLGGLRTASAAQAKMAQDASQFAIGQKNTENAAAAAKDKANSDRAFEREKMQKTELGALIDPNTGEPVSYLKSGANADAHYQNEQKQRITKKQDEAVAEWEKLNPKSLLESADAYKSKRYSALAKIRGARFGTDGKAYIQGSDGNLVLFEEKN